MSSWISLLAAGAGTGELNIAAATRLQTIVLRNITSLLTGSGAGRSRYYRTARGSSLPCREVRAAVPLPATFVGFRALRPLFAVADGLEPVFRDAQLNQDVLSGAGAAVSETQVVFRRAAFVAVALHHDRSIGEGGENALDRRRILGER